MTKGDFGKGGWHLKDSQGKGGIEIEIPPISMDSMG